MEETSNSNKHKGILGQARKLADLTPPSRNRYVDFLRAVSIMSVVLGHWIMAAPFYERGKPYMHHLLAVLDWSQWLTWIFQVMPIFFFVGGYANLTSWEANLRKEQGYAQWLGTRLERLLGPVLPLLCVWVVLTLAAKSIGIPQGFIKVGSRIALVPTWFLAVYIMVVLFVPATYAAWKRFGLWSIIALIAGAVAVDIAFFAGGFRSLGILNYFFVWLAIHQIGYAWREGLLDSVKTMLVLFLAGLFLLVALVNWGPYPLSLVGVPTDKISNTLPPKLPLLALGLAQIGLLLSMQSPARKWLDRILPWTSTVLVNGMIMTIFLWHSTSMMLIIGLGFYLIPGIFGIDPGSGIWWAWRPVWVLTFAAGTLPFLLAFSRFERPSKSKDKKNVGVFRLYAGCFLTCAGLAYLALRGIGSAPHWGYDAVALALPFIGAACAGFGPLRGGINIFNK